MANPCSDCSAARFYSHHLKPLGFWLGSMGPARSEPGVLPCSHSDIKLVRHAWGPFPPLGAQIRPQVSDYFENAANFNAVSHLEFAYFSCSLDQRAVWEGFYQSGSHAFSLNLFEGLCFFLWCTQADRKGNKEENKRSAGWVKCVPLHCSSSATELE